MPSEITPLIVPASSSQQNGSTTNGRELQCPALSEVPASSSQQNGSKTNDSKALFSSIIKHLATVIFFVIMLAAFVSSKISLALLPQYLKCNSTNGTFNENIKEDTLEVMILFAIIIPYWLFFIRGSWMLFYKKKHCWPTKTTILMCILMGVLEPMALVPIVMFVLLEFDVLTCCLLLSTAPVILLEKEPCETLFSLICILAVLITQMCGIPIWTKNDVNACYLIPLVVLKVLLNPDLYRDIERVKSWENEDEKPKWRMQTLLNFTKSCSAAVTWFVIHWIRHARPFVKFDSSSIDYHVTVCFSVHIGVSLFSYLMANIVCMANMKRACIVLPACLSIGGIALISCVDCLHTTFGLPGKSSNIDAIQGCIICFLCLSYVPAIFNKCGKDTTALSENRIFTTTIYNGVFLESWLVSNIDSEEEGNKEVPQNIDNKKEKKIFICTTMYREDEEEMKSFVKSLKTLNNWEKTKIEAHIFFDDAVCGSIKKYFAQQLIKLVNVPATNDEVATTYGMQLKLDKKDFKFPVTIHLKDKSKVLNKKRWSQVMYMKLLTECMEDNQENYILATDGDVRFDANSIKYLIDSMEKNENLGAVCSRILPKGHGPVYWFQVFEYALGHWFQKPAEHMLGSVLCAPGCFSLYRCRALKKVLDKYSTKSQTAFDFLTKDMGEDRWLCSLLIKAKFGVDYCALSIVHTHCPCTFEEFYKQRRRWIASTVANIYLLLMLGDKIREKNPRVSKFFIVYQAALMASIVLSPCAVIVVIAGGMKYAWEIDGEICIAIPLVLAIIFNIFCIFSSQRIQMIVSQLFTFIFSLLMIAVIVGIVREIAVESSAIPFAHLVNSSFSTPMPMPPQSINEDVPFSATIIYIFCTIGIMILGGIFHITEIFTLLYGVAYLISFASPYLLLIIYSACNLDDSSWGTRDAHNPNSEDDKSSCKTSVVNFIFRMINFICCIKNEDENSKTHETPVKPVCLHSHFIAEDVSMNDVAIQVEIPNSKDHEQLEEMTETEEEKKRKAFSKWEKYIEENLKPEMNDEQEQKELQRSRNLRDLRNTALKVLLASNGLWLVFIFSFANLIDLYLFGSNPVGLIFLGLFGIVFILQFFAMLIHRVTTMCYLLSKAEYYPCCKRSASCKMNVSVKQTYSTNPDSSREDVSNSSII